MSAYILKERTIKMAQKIVGEHCVIEESDYVTVNIHGETISLYGSSHGSSAHDPLESRRHLWQKTFGSAPMPAEVRNASKVFAGSLGRDLDLSPDDIQAAIDEADED